MSEGAEATPSETSSWEQADLLSLVAANPSRRDTPVAPVDPPLPAPETVAPETVLSEAVSLEAASA
ncbi:MAG: hypothetical protein ACO274_03440, partial [Vulcanococcus sp.]